MRSHRSINLISLVIFVVCCGISQSAFAQTAVKPALKPLTESEPPKELRVFHLRYAKASQAAKLLAQVVERDNPFRAAVDERTNSLLVSSSKDVMPILAELITVIDTEATGQQVRKSPSSAHSYRVHIDWLLTTDRGQPIPAKLKEVETALANHGVDGLRLAAATMASVQANLNPDFQLSCSPLENEIRLEIDGSFISNDGDNPGLRIEITAYQQREGSRNSTKQLAHVSTSVSARIGHPVVLAVAPIEGVSSVFVVTVDDANQPKTATGNQ